MAYPKFALFLESNIPIWKEGCRMSVGQSVVSFAKRWVRSPVRAHTQVAVRALVGQVLEATN